MFIVTEYAALRQIIKVTLTLIKTLVYLFHGSRSTLNVLYFANKTSFGNQNKSLT